MYRFLALIGPRNSLEPEQVLRKYLGQPYNGPPYTTMVYWALENGDRVINHQNGIAILLRDEVAVELMLRYSDVLNRAAWLTLTPE